MRLVAGGEGPVSHLRRPLENPHKAEGKEEIGEGRKPPLFSKED